MALDGFSYTFERHGRDFFDTLRPHYECGPTEPIVGGGFAAKIAFSTA